MNDERAPRERSERPSGSGKEKKLYQKPAFRYERVFETQALACGKILSGVNACKFSLKTS